MTASKLAYHLLYAIGLLALGAWFYLLRELHLMEWLAAQGSPKYAGSLNLLAIMLWMVPALLTWKYYLRWINRRFKIGGKFYETEFDAHNERLRSAKRDGQQPPQPPGKE